MKTKHKRIIQLLTILFFFFSSELILNAETIPQFFGLYLRTGEQIVELQANTVEGGGLSSLARIAINAPPSFILYHDQYSPHNLQLVHLHYTFRMGEKGGWKPTASIALKIAPMEGKQSMYLLVPAEPLAEGVYALHFGSLSVQGTGLESQAYDFVVGNPEQIVDLMIHRTNAEVYAVTPKGWEQAITEYQEALRIVPENAELQQKLAMLYYQKQDYLAAINALQRLLTLAPDTPDVQTKVLNAYFQLGQSAMQEKEYTSALEYLAQALPLAGQVEPAKIAFIAGIQAEIYYEQENFEQAFNAAQKATEKKTSSSKPYAILAFLYLRQDKQQEALKFLDQAAKRGIGKDVGGHLLVKTGYGELTIPVKDIALVSSEEVSLKSGEIFKGYVQFKE